MARPLKKGINYFPFDISFFSNPSLYRIQNKYSSIGQDVYLRLLCLIYSNGYYLDCSNMEDLTAYLMHNMSVGTVAGVNKLSEELIEEIIHALVRVSLFDKDMFDKGVLTSVGIQKRYFKIVSGRVKTDRCFRLVDNKGNELPEPCYDNFTENEVSEPETPIFDTETQENSALSTQIKEKKNKENKTTFKSAYAQPPYGERKKSYIRAEKRDGRGEERQGSFDTDEFFKAALLRSYEGRDDPIPEELLR